VRYWLNSRSRTADNLYWLARHVSARSTARILEVTQRPTTLPLG
jgi:uncharacterized alpha-E superfamily protein